MSGVQQRWRRSRGKKGRLIRIPQKNRSEKIPSIIFIRKMSGRGTSSNYSKAETNWMLDCMERIKPIGSEEWGEVVLLHATKYKEQKRNLGSIRRKFRDLYRMKIPTGDPTCPNEVRRAKRIHKDIRTKSQAITGEEDFDLENGFGSAEIIEPDLNKSSENTVDVVDIPLGQPSQDLSQPSLLEESVTLYTTPSKKSVRSYNKNNNGELVQVLNKAIKTNEDTSKAMMTAVTILAQQLGQATQTISNAFAQSQQPFQPFQQQQFASFASATKTNKKNKKRKAYDIDISDSDSD